jgi:outer membrane protein OmpA-like peptidoglycan-associated protein
MENTMSKFLIPLFLLVLVSCSQVPSVMDRDVPSAFFVFFDENSAKPVEGSPKILDEVSAFLNYYDDLSVSIVGQRAVSETSDTTGGALDAQRAAVVAAQLQWRGIEIGRMVVDSKGVSETMAAVAGGDEAVDRRVDIMIRIVSVPVP